MTDPKIIGGIVEKIKTSETKSEREMLVAALGYRELRDEVGSAKKAAKIAEAEGLRYAEARSLGRLIAWADLIEAIQGGVDTVHPLPFTEGQVRPLLSQHFQDEAGPGGLADIWNELDEQTPKAFIEAAKEAYPKPKPKREAVADTKALTKTIKKAVKPWGKYMAQPITAEAAFATIDLHYKPGLLAAAEQIEEQCGSLTKFMQLVKEAKLEEAEQRKQTKEALVKGAQGQL